MIVVCILYIVVGILLAIFYTKRLIRNEPDVDHTEIISYFMACIIFWPLCLLIDDLVD